MVKKEHPHIINEVDLNEATVSLTSDDIVYVYMKDNCVLDVELQMTLFDVYHKVTGGKLTPFIFHGGENVSTTKEARENFKKIEEQFPISASAVIANNLAYKLVANFYLQFYKPKRPYKVFNTEKDALKWLKCLSLIK